MHRLSAQAFVFFAAAALFASGCSADNGGSGTSGSGGPVAMDGLAAAYLNAICTTQERCGSAGIFPFTFSSKATCIVALGNMKDLNFSEIDAVKAGKMTYDGKKAAACIASLAATACGAFYENQMADCQATFTGSLTIGDACDDDSYCVSTNCWRDGTTSLDCPGVCKATKAIGDSCGGASGFCGGKLVCTAGTCAALSIAKIGAECDNSQCEAGAYCAYGAKSVCTAVGSVGDACKGGDQCAKGLRCFAAKCAALGKVNETCAAQSALKGGGQCAASLNCTMTLKAGVPDTQVCLPAKKIGEACAAVFECDGYDLYCTADKKCASLPLIGAACVDKATSPFQRCGFGLKCDKATTTCVADVPGKVGDACPGGGGCDSALICDSATQKCAAKPAPVCK